MTKVLCPRQHHYTAKSPIGKHISDCPFCLIEDCQKNLSILKKWVKEVEIK